MAYKMTRPRKKKSLLASLLGLGDALDAHGCTPDQVWNDTAGGCVSLEDNLAIINTGVAASSSSGSVAPVVSIFKDPKTGGLSTTGYLALAGGAALVYFKFIKKGR